MPTCAMKREVLFRILRIIVTVCAAFTGICFLSYLFSVLAHPGTIFSYTLPIVMCAFVLLPLFLEKRLKKRLPHRLFRAGQMLYGTAVVFFCVTFSGMCVMLKSYETVRPEVTENTVVCVYGCRVKGDEPGEMLQERLDCALSLLSVNPATLCMVSGGLDEGAFITEGAVMARYLIQNGIDPARILTDESAESTKGNIRAFLALLADRNFADRDVISVSSAFHMPRIAFLCEQYGLSCSAYVGAETKRFSILFPNVVREYLAYVKMLLLNSYN